MSQLPTPQSKLLRMFSGTIDAAPYFLIGLALTCLKQTLDYLLIQRIFFRPWAPLAYGLPVQVGGLFALDQNEQMFYLSLCALSLPFVVVGVALTLRRLRSLNWPLWLVAFFFAPVPINLVFFLVLSVMPSRHREVYIKVIDELDGPVILKPVPSSSWSWGLASILLPMPFGAAVIYLSVYVFRDYGWGVFFGLPFVLPMISVILYSLREPKTLGQCMALGCGWIGMATLMLLATAFEGAICILMALPLLVPVALAGTLVGYFIAGGSSNLAGESGDGPTKGRGLMMILLLALLPTMVGAEHALEPESPLFEVRTSVVIDAPPEKVWRHVITFPELAPPRDWLFRAGIAYPIRARIDGEGVGATRRCEFSTGAFVEPIEVWDEPRLLRFGVTSNPPAMQEWNPFFEIHPPHLEGFLVSRRGQFLLSRLPGGRTRLEGTTWYHHGLAPAGYWRLWSDAILHRIHGRVLEHVKTLAERD
jgi:hypothetical protein